MSLLRYKENIIFDTETNLMWQDELVATKQQSMWADALQYSKIFSLSGFTDWSLPDSKALKNLYSNRQYLKSHAFAYGYWTIAPSVYVSFVTGNIYYEAKESSLGYTKYVRKANVSKLNIDSFLSPKARFKIDGDKIILHSNIINNTELFLVTEGIREYFGTKNEILKELGFEYTTKQSIGYSLSPFVEIQKQVQEKINNYLTSPMPKKPEAPTPLQLVKDEFETKLEFDARVAIAVQEQEVAINALHKKYNQELESRKAELQKRELNLEEFKQRQLNETVVDVFGIPVLSDAEFDAETNTMFMSVTMSNAKWHKKIAVGIADREFAKRFKNDLSTAIVEVEFALENSMPNLERIQVEFESVKLTALLEASDFEAQRIGVVMDTKKDSKIDSFDDGVIQEKPLYQMIIKTFEDEVLLEKIAKLEVNNQELLQKIEVMKQQLEQEKGLLAGKLKVAEEQGTKAVHKTNELDANNRGLLQKLEASQQEKQQLEQEKGLLAGKLKVAEEQNSKALHKTNKLDTSNQVLQQKLETSKQEKQQLEEEKGLLAGKLKVAEGQIISLDKTVSQKIVVRESFGDF